MKIFILKGTDQKISSNVDAIREINVPGDLKNIKVRYEKLATNPEKSETCI